METLGNEVRLRGSLSGTEVLGDRLHLWFDSPTGDTSDSLIYTMPCRSEAEAREIEAMHRNIWGLEPVDMSKYRSELDKPVETDEVTDLFSDVG